MTDLHDLVNGLTRTDKMRVTVGYQGYTATAPCLLAQLAEAIEYRDDRNGTRSIPGSRPPLDMTALDLWVEICSNLRQWAVFLDVHRAVSMKPTDNRPSGKPALPPVGGLLRAVAAAARDRAEQGVLDALTRSCRSWTDRINGLFSPGSGQRQLYGVACIRCDATSVWTDRDGERILTPAIILTRIPDAGSQLICQACTWTRDLPSYDYEPEGVPA